MIIFPERLKRESPIFVYRSQNISNASLGMINYPRNGSSHVTFLKFGPMVSLESVKL